MLGWRTFSVLLEVFHSGSPLMFSKPLFLSVSTERVLVHVPLLTEVQETVLPHTTVLFPQGSACVK